MFEDIDDCFDHGCVNYQCKDGINSYTANIQMPGLIDVYIQTNI